MRHAHGFVVQTLADLGIVGLAVALALLLAGWRPPGAPRIRSTAAGRAGGAWLRSATARVRAGWRVGERDLALYSPERIGLLSMLCLVVVFGVHSLIDWTWYVPGNACVALLCAGWLAGRGPLGAMPGAAMLGLGAHRRWGSARTRRLPPTDLDARRAGLCAHGGARRRGRGARCWRPGRSGSRSARKSARQQALGAARRATSRARCAAANAAVSRDPLSAEALFTLADVQSDSGQRSRGTGDARASGATAALQPADVAGHSAASTWRANPQAALRRAAGRASTSTPS